MAFFCAGAGLIAAKLETLPMLAIAGATAGALVLVESRLAFRRKRLSAVQSEWPGFVEYVVTAIESGVSLFETFSEAPNFFEAPLGPHLAEVRALLHSGSDVPRALRELPWFRDFSQAQILAAQLEAYENTGAPGIAGVLRQAASDIRSQNTLESELRARIGWVLGTARLGVLSPWLMVVLLSQRQEGRLAYSSAQGSSLLLIGTGVCALAYLVILKRANFEFARSRFWVGA